MRISKCPNCDKPLQTTELSCSSCKLQLRGHFERGCKFCALDDDQRRLLDVFLSCRGVIRDMEKELGVSYPTVRGRIDALMTALGYAPRESKEEIATRRREILDRLEAGELTVDQAAAELKELGK
jgi:hypothetical protein